MLFYALFPSMRVNTIFSLIFRMFFELDIFLSKQARTINHDERDLAVK
jgi:hypothetical protein